MRRLVAFLLGGVPLCASTERAVAATLADWRHESGRGLAPAARVIVGARSVIALMRAVAGSAFRQLPGEFTSPFLRRLIVAGVLAIALFAWLVPAPRGATSSGMYRAWLSVLQSTSFAFQFALVVVFASEVTGRQTRHGPSLAGGLMLSAMLFVALFVAVPETYNHFVLLTGQGYRWDGIPPMPSPIRLLIGGPTREISLAYVAFGVLNWLTLSLSAWAFAVLAFRVRQFASPHVVRRFVAVWGAILFVLSLIVGIRLAPQALGFRAYVPFFLVYFTLATGALAVSSWLSRRAPGRSQ